TASTPNKFEIGGKDYVGDPVCGPRKEGGYGWSIKDPLNETVEFTAAACVRLVICHDTNPIRFECAEPGQC
ncbi:hypothetical protein PMAYCL1PPCAC_14131, partial [Pristionchus mayeri]